MNKIYFSKTILLWLIVGIFIQSTNAQELYLPFSNQYYQRDFAISPAGNHVVYTHVRQVGQQAVLVERYFENGGWSLPRILSFSQGPYDIEPVFSQDGSQLFFVSNKEHAGNSDGNFDIWQVSLNEDGSWGIPEPLPPVINTSANEFYPSIDAQGNLYFTAAYDRGKGGEDIWMSVKTADGYGVPEGLPSTVNTSFDEFNAMVFENTLYFSSFGRPDGLGGGDLYKSQKSSNWQNAVNMGAPVNTDRLDFCPSISPDGEFLYFTSEASITTEQNVVDDILKVDEVAKALLAPKGGNIYRIAR